MARPRAVIDKDEFLLLYRKGFSDQVIAEHFCVHRSTIARKRRQMSLPPIRKRGERGPGTVQKDMPYYAEIFRLLKHVGKYIREETRRVRCEAAAQGNKEVQERLYLLSWLAAGVDPAPVPHPVPGKYVQDSLRPKSERVRHLLNLEYLADRAGLAGVPGPSIINLARVFKTADEKTKSELVRQAIAEAGYVGVHETVDHVLENGFAGYDNWVELWDRQRDAVLQWVPGT